MTSESEVSIPIISIINIIISIIIISITNIMKIIVSTIISINNIMISIIMTRSPSRPPRRSSTVSPASSSSSSPSSSSWWASPTATGSAVRGAVACFLSQREQLWSRWFHRENSSIGASSCLGSLGMFFSHSLLVPEFWDWIFLFPSPSRILKIPSYPVPELWL